MDRPLSAKGANFNYNLTHCVSLSFLSPDRTFVAIMKFFKTFIAACLYVASFTGVAAEDLSTCDFNYISSQGTRCSLVENQPDELPNNTRRLQSGTLSLLFQDNGPIFLSVNGVGTNNGGTQIGVLKPLASATVKSAFLFATTHGSAPFVVLNAVGPILWDNTAVNPSATYLKSNVADVTSVVKSTLDAAHAGESFISVLETANTNSVDGEVLAVIFEDAAFPQGTSVTLFLGAQDSNGDSFTLNFADPLTASDLASP
jgi:hypothetical protein